MHILEADSIQLQFDFRKILSDIYVKCETGKITGLLGRNGAGKSCLLNIIYGAMHNDDKSVRFNSMQVKAPYKQPQLIRYLPQHRFIPQGLNLAKVFSDYEVDFSVFKKIFPDFKAELNAPVYNLSTGQQRLVEVYCILKSQTQFVLLDEPFSFLAPVQVDRLKEVITEEKTNKGILLTDHLYNHVIEVSHNLYLLKDGKIHTVKGREDIERLGYVRFNY